MYLEQGKSSPLLAALLKYSASAHLHVPAHRQGEAAPECLVDVVGRDVFRLDLTEIYGLDDLHNPQGVIAAAQELAARLYGAGSSFFLVNGTSCGLQALVMAVCGPGEQIILPRNVHRSVLAGLVFSGADPVYMMPEVIPEFGILAGLAPAKLENLLQEHAGVKAVMAVYPTYYGVGGDMRALARPVHRRDKPFLVDEAHGAHLAFHPGLPEQSLAAGADAVVQSTHKLGGALTQASLLHLQGQRLEWEKVARALKLVQTTSPSYLLMASLDAARRQLALKGRELLDRALNLAYRTKSLLREIKGLKVLDSEDIGVPGAEVLDPTRLVINVARTGLTGHQVAGLLARRYRVHVEMADALNIVAIIGMGTTEADCSGLVRALIDITGRESTGHCARREYLLYPADLPKKGMTPREAWLAPVRKITLDRAAGEISAEWVAVYPPGIPVLGPGEIINREIISYLAEVRWRGLQVQGPEDSSLATIKIIDK